MATFNSTRISRFVIAVLMVAGLFASPFVPMPAYADEGVASYDAPEPTAQDIAAFQAVKDKAAYDATDGAYDRDKAYGILQYINTWRAQNGLPKLAWDSDLEASALVSARVLSADFSSDAEQNVAAPPENPPAGGNSFMRGVDQGADLAFGRMTHEGPGSLANDYARSVAAACYYYQGHAYWVVRYGRGAGDGQRFTSAGTAGGAQKMLRLYNPNSGEHFYTANAYERDNVVLAGWNYEGVGWTAPSSGDPVYRLYNPNAGDHHYTTSTSERDALVSVGWKYEGVGWQSGGSVPLYRQYNPNAVAGAHNYTTSRSENDYLVSLGWRYEGIGWYGL